VIALAGYLAATRYSRPEWAAPTLPAGELVSMSECMTDVVIAEPWDPFFTEPPVAPPGHHVLAVGVPVDYLPALRADLEDWLPPLLAEPRAVPDWPVLGHELIGADHGSWHTWTCLGGLVSEVGAATGVQPGPWGLIPDEHDARRAADWLTESIPGEHEVYLWVPALLLSSTPPAPSTPR
jgi:hypothetical protein